MPPLPTSHDDDFAEYVDGIVKQMAADGFGDADSRRPRAPWYRTTPAVFAAVSIAAGLVLIAVSSALLISHRSPSESTKLTAPSPTSRSASATPGRSATPGPSSPPPVASPPPASPAPASPSPAGPPPSANTQYAPPPAGPPPAAPPSSPAPPNMRTGVTRPPVISVQPTHRQAFPNQG